MPMIDQYLTYVNGERMLKHLKENEEDTQGLLLRIWDQARIETWNNKFYSISGLLEVTEELLLE